MKIMIDRGDGLQIRPTESRHFDLTATAKRRQDAIERVACAFDARLGTFRRAQAHALRPVHEDENGWSVGRGVMEFDEQWREQQEEQQERNDSKSKQRRTESSAQRFRAQNPNAPRKPERHNA